MEEEKESTWEDLELDEEIIKGLQKTGHKGPTKVQQLSLRQIGFKRDQIISSHTGTGKTLCFALAILSQHIADQKIPFNNQSAEKYSLGLVLAPTRELAMQISAHINNISIYLKSPPRTVNIIGGMSRQKQIRLLNGGSKKHIKGCNNTVIIVATPGRLYELIEENADQVPILLNLHKVKFLVIDEADRMVESGHFAELRKILHYIYYTPDTDSTMVKEPEINQEKTQEIKTLFENTGKSKSTRNFLFSSNLESLEKAPKDLNELIKNAIDLDDNLANMENILMDEKPQKVKNLHEEEKSAKSTKKKTKFSLELTDEIPLKMNKIKRTTYVCSATLLFSSSGRFKSKKETKRRGKIEDRMESMKEIVKFRGKPYIVNLTEKEQLPNKLSQFYISCAIDEKDIYTFYFLEDHKSESTIIFANSITCVKRLVTILKILRMERVFCLHGKMEQRQRLKQLDRFKLMHKEMQSEGDKGINNILVCTDVGSRGLDIPCVENVVHYQFPGYYELYIHRCGRTARINKRGRSLALVAPSDKRPADMDWNSLKEYPLAYNKLESIRTLVQKGKELEQEQHKSLNIQKNISWKNKLEADSGVSGVSGEGCRVSKKGNRKMRGRIGMLEREYDDMWKGKFESAIYLEQGEINRSGHKSAFLTPQLVRALNSIPKAKPTSHSTKSIRKGKRKAPFQ